MIAVAGYGGFGQVVETLPAGYSYQGSGLSESGVAVEGQTVAFTLLGDERFTYRVAAPSTEGAYAFSGVLLDADKVEKRCPGSTSTSVMSCESVSTATDALCPSNRLLELLCP